MALAFVLLLIGALLLCAEIFLPGFGICGISGVVVILISAAVAFFSGPFGAYVVLSEITLLVVFIILAFNYVKKRQLKNIVMADTLSTETYESLEEFAGRQGIALTTFRPIGSVDFNGAILEAYSESGYIKKGQYVKVTRVDNRKIYVKPVQ